jgi:elongator complex protein 1
MLPISSFPVFCPVSQQVAIKLGPTVITLLLGLSAGSKLYATTPSHAIAPLLSSAVSSFAVAGSFLIYTTSAHESTYIPLSALAELLETPGLDMREGGAEGALLRFTKAAEKRRIERGSRIVAAIPSAMSLVLQMPRGNLETINPRPLVLEVVKSDIDQWVHPIWSIGGILMLKFTAWSTEKAFLACRKHRIDLNFLVEHNSNLFSENVGRFVDQIPEVDHLTLFLSGIGCAFMRLAASFY